MKRLAVEISEIAFIANDSGPSTPVKGDQWYLFNDNECYILISLHRKEVDNALGW